MNMLEFLKDITDIAPFVGSPPFYGVRFNPLKLSRQRFEELSPVKITPCGFYSCGYRSEGEAPGTHPLHMAADITYRSPVR